MIGLAPYDRKAKEKEQEVTAKRKLLGLDKSKYNLFYLRY